MRNFFEKAFGFETLRSHDSERAAGYVMSDGAINIGIFKFKTDQLGKGIDYVGLHHFGVQVDDPDEYVDRVLSQAAQADEAEMELSPLPDGRPNRPDNTRGLD